MNVLFIVVDSLRYDSLWLSGHPSPTTPFLERLDQKAISFRRAYAAECWTLPSHVSFFTGLLPSEHGAHFQSMAYHGKAKTLAEIAAAEGYATELLTRNSILDGSIPGVAKGFQRNTQVLGKIPGGLTPLLLVLALAKPRVRRLIRESGFFGLAQKERASFLMTLARMGIPADAQLLNRTLERLSENKRQRRRHFTFVNLYDVHAPYSPSLTSPLRSIATPSGLLENIALPWVLPKVSSHSYLKPGFRISKWSRRMLLARYHRAIELADQKLQAFFEAADAEHLLDDTLVIVTSDHGEGFGEHGLYLHDASLYETHLHVPLWVLVPGAASQVIDHVVSTRDLFSLVISAVTGGVDRGGTLLDPAHRAQRPAAYAEHFHYSESMAVCPQYRLNQAAVVSNNWKVIARGHRLEAYALHSDRDEKCPIHLSGSHEVEAIWRDDGLNEAHCRAALSHLANLAQVPGATARGGRRAAPYGTFTTAA